MEGVEGWRGGGGRTQVNRFSWGINMIHTDTQRETHTHRERDTHKCTHTAQAPTHPPRHTQTHTYMHAHMHAHTPVLEVVHCVVKRILLVVELGVGDHGILVLAVHLVVLLLP